MAKKYHGLSYFFLCHTDTSHNMSALGEADRSGVFPAHAVAPGGDADLRSVFESLADGVAVLDSEGRIAYHNASLARLLGMPDVSLERRVFAELLHRDDREDATAFFRAQLATPGSTRSLEVRSTTGLDRAGRTLSMVASTRLGSPPSLVVSARDETARLLQLAREEQEGRAQSLGRLATSFAHEFNNVLMGIQPFAELMQRPGVNPSAVAKGAGSIMGSIARGKRVATDILRFTHPVPPVLTCVELREWWGKLSPSLSRTIGSHVAFEASIPAGLAVMADPKQLSELIEVLVSNALDAMPVSGALQVHARQLDLSETLGLGIVHDPRSFVQISVSDTGREIAQGILLHAFEPSFKTRLAGGPGLGLAVAQQVMSRQGGLIFAASDADRGTTFHLIFPSMTA